MALSDFQFMINTLALGAGTSYLIHDVDGLGLPDVTAADVSRGTLNGEYRGFETYGGRTITISMTIKGTDASNARTLWQSLAFAWQSGDNTDEALNFKMPGMQEQIAFGRPRRLHPGKWDKLKSGVIDGIVLEFHATDSLIYDATLQSVNVRYYPSYGYTTVTNTGTAPAPMLVTFTGTGSGGTALHGPLLANNTHSEQLAYSGIILASGQSFSVDTGTGQTTYSYSQYKTVNSYLLKAWPGSSSMYLNEYDSGGGAATAAVANLQFRNAWWSA